MNDLGTPPPDWDRIFDRAHRRIAGRLLLVGAVGGFCALLLLGGGLSAQGAVSLGIGGHPAKPDAVHAATKAKAKVGAVARHRKRAASAELHAASRKRRDETIPKETNKHAAKHRQWNPCAGKSGSSAEQQYCEDLDGSATAEGTGASSDAVDPGDQTNSDQQATPPKTTEVAPTG